MEPCSKPLCPELLSQVMQRQYLVLHIAFAGFNHLLGFFVGKPSVGIDNRRPNH
jgi:hypothetical protein